MKRLFTAIVFFVAATAFAGVSYRFETNTSGLQTTSTTGRVIADGSNMRLEFEHGDNVLFKDSSVVVSNDGGKTLNVLDPAAKTYFTLKLDEILGGSSSLFGGPDSPIKMSFTNPKVGTHALGDGGMLEGYATKKSSLDAAYDIVVEAMGQKIATHVDMHTESWHTDKLPEAMMSFMQMKGFRTGNEAMDKVIDASSSPEMKGFPLKSVTAVHTKGPGQEMSVTTTTAAHDVKSVTTRPAQFAIPVGYTKTESPLEKMLGAIKK